MAEFSKEQIRVAVREALRESLSSAQPRPNRSADSAFAKMLHKAMQSNVNTPVEISLDTSGQLNRFVKELADCMDDDRIKLAIRSGRLRFKSAKPANGATKRSAPAEQRGSGNRAAECLLDSGVLTESGILKLAKEYQRAVVGPGVVLTPLAKDRARTIKFEIVRQ